jgi:prepilin-type processing-associated H-X9-DG protein
VALCRTGFGYGARDFQSRIVFYYKPAHIVNPAPAMCYVLLDEHPDGINAGGFANMMVENPANARIIDYPASYHNGAAGLSFADGHCEIKKWRDPRTRAPIRNSISALPLNVASPNNADMIWLTDRTSSRNK